MIKGKGRESTVCPQGLDKIENTFNYSRVPIKRVSIINEDPGLFTIILNEYNLINEYTGKMSISVNEYVVINEYRGSTYNAM